MYSISTVESLIAFCNQKITSYQKLCDDFAAKREDDKRHDHAGGSSTWLAWNATTLLGASVHCLEAQSILSYITDGERTAPASGWLAVVLRESEREAFRGMRVSSRSSLLDANLAEDYKRAFHVELAGMLRAA